MLNAARQEKYHLNIKTTTMLDYNDVIGIVHAHASARDTVLRHLPYWLRTCKKIVVVTPLGHDLKLDHPRVDEVQKIENGSSYSRQTNMRTYECLNLAREKYKKYPYVMLFEYDSLCWGPIPDKAIPRSGAISATKFMNETASPVKGKTFLASYYLHYPQIYSREALDAILCSMESKINFDAEHGYTDRFLGLAAERAQIPILNLLELGLSYSWENISVSKYPQRVKECISAIKGGAFMSHGIKDIETLKIIAENSPFGYLKE